MSYSVDLRERVVVYVRGGGSPTKAAQLFQVGRTTLYRWLGSADLWPKLAKERKRKLDKAALAAHVQDFPDALLRERAAHFGVTINAIWVALKKLAITKKTTRYSESRCEERITFLRQLRAWVAKHGWKNVVYFDESGFQATVHRRHGWHLGATRSLVKSPATTMNEPISSRRNGAEIGSRQCCSRQVAPI
jgi:putative transposase